MTNKHKLLHLLKHIESDILTHNHVFKTMKGQERFYHQGKVDEAEGIKVAFLGLFEEEINNVSD